MTWRPRPSSIAWPIHDRSIAPKGIMNTVSDRWTLPSSVEREARFFRVVAWPGDHAGARQTSKQNDLSRERNRSAKAQAKMRWKTLATARTKMGQRKRPHRAGASVDNSERLNQFIYHETLPTY